MHLTFYFASLGLLAGTVVTVTSATAQDDIQVGTGVALPLSKELQTRTEQLTISSDLSLGVDFGEETGLALSQIAPNLSFGYSRTARDAELRLTARLQSSKVADISASDVVTDEDLTPEEREDLEALLALEAADDTTRLSFSAGAMLETRRRAPLGATFSLDFSGSAYEETDVGLEDEVRVTAGTSLRANLSPVTTATANLNHTVTLRPEDKDNSRWALDLGLTQARPTGQVGSALELVRDGDKSYGALSLSGARRSPTTELSARGGVTRTGEGETALIGNVNLSYNLPQQAQLGFGLTRRVSLIDLDENSGVEARNVTTLSVNYGRPLTRLWRTEFDASFIQSQPFSEGETERYGSVDTSLSRLLTKNWALSIGLRHSYEDIAEEDVMHDNEVLIRFNRTTRISF